MSRLFAALYDPVMALTERSCLANWRHELLQNAAGSVLELGAGSGRNLPHYTEPCHTRWLCEPDPAMYRKLLRRAATYDERFHLSAAAGESLPFANGQFDAVICTFVLCTVSSVEATLAEAHRVLVPGGQLLLIEHVAAEPGTSRHRAQQLLAPLWRRLAGGCHILRDPRPALLDAGFRPRNVVECEMSSTPSFLAPAIRGSWAKS